MALCLCLRADRLRPAADDREDKSIQELTSRASDRYKAGDLNQAIQLYRQGVDLSGSRFPRLRALNLIGLEIPREFAATIRERSDPFGKHFRSEKRNTPTTFSSKLAWV